MHARPRPGRMPAGPGPDPATIDARGHRALLRDLAAGRGGTWVTCAGHSMEPTIRRGDRVRIEACARVRVGEIALFEAARGYVLHRVALRVPGTGWLVHVGDANPVTAPSLSHADRVVGRAALPRRIMPWPVWWASAQRLGQAGQRGARRALGRIVRAAWCQLGAKSVPADPGVNERKTPRCNRPHNSAAQR